MTQTTLPRKRPYIYVSHSNRPAKDENGKLIEGKIEAVETFNVVDYPSKRLDTYASVVIDLFAFKCVKNRFSRVEGDDTTTINHYLRKYKEKVNTALTAYLGMNNYGPSFQPIVLQAVAKVKEIAQQPNDSAPR